MDRGTERGTGRTEKRQRNIGTATRETEEHRDRETQRQRNTETEAHRET